MRIEDMSVLIAYYADGPKGPGVYYSLAEKLPDGGAIMHDVVGPFTNPGLAVQDLAKKVPS